MSLRQASTRLTADRGPKLVRAIKGPLVARRPGDGAPIPTNTGGPALHCVRCTRRLSIHNLGTHCHACQAAERKAAS